MNEPIAKEDLYAYQLKIQNLAVIISSIVKCMFHLIDQLVKAQYNIGQSEKYKVLLFTLMRQRRQEGVLIFYKANLQEETSLTNIYLRAW